MQKRQSCQDTKADFSQLSFSTGSLEKVISERLGFAFFFQDYRSGLAISFSGQVTILKFDFYAVFHIFYFGNSIQQR